MLLTIDVGNSNIVLGIYDSTALVRDWRIETHRSKTSDEYATLLDNLLKLANLSLKSITAVIISSVVPAITSLFQELCHKYLELEPLIVTAEIRTGLTIDYDNPAEIGADRIVNMVAGYERFGSPLIVIDFGTATTFDYLDSSGVYCGGAIAPGLYTALDALVGRTSKLPKVEMKSPPTVIGKSTLHSMQSGCFTGYVELVDGLVRRIIKEAGEQPRVIATGGLAGLIAAESETIEEVIPTLALDGLRTLYQLNQD